MNWYKRAAEDVQTIKDKSLPIPKMGVDIFLNPNKGDLERLADSTGEIRGLIVGNDQFWAWKTYDSVHAIVSKYLKEHGLASSGVPIYANVYKGQIIGATVTDASKNTIWEENPQVREAIFNNVPFMALTDQDFENSADSIYYWNEDVVGKWDKKEKMLEPEIVGDVSTKQFEEIDRPTSTYYKDWN